VTQHCGEYRDTGLSDGSNWDKANTGIRDLVMKITGTNRTDVTRNVENTVRDTVVSPRRSEGRSSGRACTLQLVLDNVTYRRWRRRGRVFERVLEVQATWEVARWRMCHMGASGPLRRSIEVDRDFSNGCS